MIEKKKGKKRKGREEWDASRKSGVTGGEVDDGGRERESWGEWETEETLILTKKK